MNDIERDKLADDIGLACILVVTFVLKAAAT